MGKEKKQLKDAEKEQEEKKEDEAKVKERLRALGYID